MKKKAKKEEEDKKKKEARDRLRDKAAMFEGGNNNG